MENGEEVMEQSDRTNDIWKVRVSLSPIEERPKAVDLDQPEAAEYGHESDGQVEDVEGEEAEHVDVEDGRVHVVYPQLDAVGLQDAVVQKTSPEVKDNVEDVQKVGEVV